MVVVIPHDNAERIPDGSNIEFHPQRTLPRASVHARTCVLLTGDDMSISDGAIIQFPPFFRYFHCD